MRAARQAVRCSVFVSSDMVAVSPARMSRAREPNEKSTKGEGEGAGEGRVGVAHELQHFIAMRQKKAARVGAVRAGIPLRRGGFALLLAFRAALGMLEQCKGRKGKEARWGRAKFEDFKKT